MIIDLARMRTLVRRPAGIDDTDENWPDSDIDELLNFSLWDIEGKFPFREKEVETSFVTVAGTIEYAMPTPYEALKQLAIVDPLTLQHTPLDPMTVDDYESQYNEESTAQATPTRYFRQGSKIKLWPTPDKVYTIILRKLATLTDLANDTDISPLPQEWTEVLIYGARKRLFFELGDFTRSTQVHNIWMSMVRSITPTPAKEKMDYHRAGLQILSNTDGIDD